MKPALASVLLQRRRVVRRIAQAEGGDRLAREPALFQVATRLCARAGHQRRLEERCRRFDEPVEPLALVLAGFVARAELRHRHAGFAGQPLDRLGERQPVGLHEEREDVAVLAGGVDLSGVNERGAGGASLKVKGNDETVLSASPALELGTQFQTGGGTQIRPYVRGGATFFDDTGFALDASFAGSPGGVGPFRIRTNSDDVVANVGAGIDLIGPRGAELKLFYEGSFGDIVSDQSGGIKASVPF